MGWKQEGFRLDVDLVLSSKYVLGPGHITTHSKFNLSKLNFMWGLMFVKGP